MRFCLFAPAAVIFFAARARAEGGAPVAPSSDRTLSDAATAPEQAAAHEHFERALSEYRAGKYRKAVLELEAALDRDPTGKDLVYNLALVQEKLGDFAGAISSLQRFQGMEKDPAELERATQTIQRLEGARAEVEVVRPAPPPSPQVPVCPTLRARGKFDAWVMGAGGLSVASLIFGTAFGVRALTLDPRGEATGPDTTFQNLRSRAERAHAAAIIADVAFSTSLLAGATATTLYFGRYADAAPAQHAFFAYPRLPRIAALWLEFRY